MLDRIVRTSLLAVLMLMLAGLAFGHLCNNIYRTPDRVIVKPEKPTATVDGTESFRVFVQNNYPTYLDNLRLVAKSNSPNIDVAIAPDSMKRLKAGERSSFKVTLTAKPGAKASSSALAFSISADNIGWTPVEPATVDSFKSVLEKESNLSATVQAAESLVSRRDPAGSQYLVKILNNPGTGADYHCRAIRALGKGGDRKNISVLRGVLERQDGFEVGNALLALGLLKDQQSTFSPFFQDRDEFIRTSALAGSILSGGSNKAHIAVLRQSLKSENAYARIAAGWALASRRDRAAISVLDQAFTTDDAFQRVTAGDALVNIANRRL